MGMFTRAGKITRDSASFLGGLKTAEHAAGHAAKKISGSWLHGMIGFLTLGGVARSAKWASELATNWTEMKTGAAKVGVQLDDGVLPALVEFQVQLDQIGYTILSMVIPALKAIPGAVRGTASFGSSAIETYSDWFKHFKYGSFGQTYGLLHAMFMGDNKTTQALIAEGIPGTPEWERQQSFFRRRK